MRTYLFIILSLRQICICISLIAAIYIIGLLPSIIGYTLAALLDSQLPAWIGVLLNFPYLVLIVAIDSKDISNQVERIMSRRMNPDD